MSSSAYERCPLPGGYKYGVLVEKSLGTQVGVCLQKCRLQEVSVCGGSTLPHFVLFSQCRKKREYESHIFVKF